MSTRQSIIVVDDTAANLRLLTGILAGQEYMVRPVMDGALALSAAQSDPPDLILLDIMMPNMSGYEVCKRLKADERTRNIPVIFISAKEDILDKVKAFSLGAVDYITKPFQDEEVIARVRTHLMLRNLQRRLEEQNTTLSETLYQLQAAQAQLIQQEKMAALGQLVAGIAHEINTPLGAIRASITNISNALETSLQQLPQLFQQLPPEYQTAFLTFIRTSLQNNEHLSSKEARQAKRVLRSTLSEQGFDVSDSMVTMLVNMGIYQDISPFINLFQRQDACSIVQTAYNLFLQQNNSRNILIAVERASKMVFALKTYTHYDYSGPQIRANITEGIEVVLMLYHNQLKKGIDVIRKYTEIPDILCYPDELNQVWTNLIHNAIHAMEGRGTLTISINREQHAEDNVQHIIVRITDSGCGIPEEIQPRIFDPFFTTKPAGQGSGLGLDIVQKIIERHQGKIEVESRPGQTTFHVYLPIDGQGSQYVK